MLFFALLFLMGQEVDVVPASTCEAGSFCPSGGGGSSFSVIAQSATDAAQRCALLQSVVLASTGRGRPVAVASFKQLEQDSS